MLTNLIFHAGIAMTVINPRGNTPSTVGAGNTQATRGMPFEPLSLAFNRVNYYVDMPAVSLFH